MRHYLDNEFKEEHFKIAASVRSEEYDVKMKVNM